MHALLKDITFYGMSLLSADAVIPDMAAAMTPDFATGKLKGIVSKSYPLQEATQALNDLLASKVFSKLVLVP